MKLISCYIANFGGLSDYTCSFEDGLTVVMEPNGFGKTTLAEFIRAMFYGFPRSSKALEKNRRKKYLPWQGGRFGGNLVFEHEGVPYRVERTFGKRPAGDTFALYDLRTNKKSDRFTQDLGLELFRLDADSFERSTYLPQLRGDITSLYTNGIQAKLGDLVEDTNDVNNFEAAKTALQKKRSALIPFRGTGGAVAQAQRSISELEARIAAAGAAAGELEALQAELKKDAADLDAKTKERSGVRQALGLAAQAAGRSAVAERYGQLREAYGQTQAREKTLTEKYPRGLPNDEQVEAIARTIERMGTLRAQMEPTGAVLEAKKRLEGQQRFASAIPSQERLQRCQEQLTAYESAMAQREGDLLGSEDAEKLNQLEKFFAPGVPDDGTLSRCRELRRELAALEVWAAQAGPVPEERERARELAALFPQGLPSDEALAKAWEDLDAAKRLREENERIAFTDGNGNEPKKSRAFPAALVLGLLSFLAGGALLLARSYAFGAFLIGLGTISLIAAVYLRLRDMLGRALSGADRNDHARGERDRQRVRENEAEIRRRERAAADFVGQYMDGPGGPGEKLNELTGLVAEYRSLSARLRAGEQRQQALQAETDARTDALHALLFPYFGEEFPEDAQEELLLKRQELTDLRRRREAAGQRAEAADIRLNALAGEIAGFLAPFFGRVEPGDFREKLATLQRGCDAYRRDVELVNGQETQLAQKEAEFRQCRQQLEAFSRQYALSGELTRDTLQALREDMRLRDGLPEALRAGKEAVETFYKQNQAILSAPESKESRDMETLRSEEARLDRELEALTEAMAKKRRRAETLRETADQVPAWEDALAAQERIYREGRENARLLDSTVEFLEKAQESLSASYIGPIRQAFDGYLRRLTGGDGGKVYIDPALEITMDRQGEARPMGYLSPGQADLLMLCMRLALVDALFKGQRVFIILDDPFVNLDDAHTRAATELLRDLARDRQIIYLVCHSSRSI